MSGALSWQPIQPVDIGGAFARGQQMQANRLAMLAQQRQLQQGQQMDEFLAQNAQGLAASDPTKRMNVLAQLASMGPQGFALAAPQIEQTRNYMDFMGPGGASASPGAPAINPAPGGTSRAVSERTASTDLPVEARAFLDTIAGPESAGAYNVRWGGPQGPQTFGSYAAHPNIRAPGPEGPSSAAGRYQFVHSTWAPLAQRYGATDFSPQTQDRVAWSWAQDEYRSVTGRNLLEDLRDPARRGEIQRVMARPSMWTTANLGRYDANLRAYGDGAQRAVVMAADGAEPLAATERGGMSSGGVGAPSARPQVGFTSDGLPIVPGFDMDRVRRAMSMPNNPLAVRYLQQYRETAQLMQRGEPPETWTDATRTVNGETVQGQQSSRGQFRPFRTDREPDTWKPGERIINGRRVEGQVNQRGEFRPISPGEDPSNNEFSRANTLRDEFTALSANFRTVQTAYDNIRSAAQGQNGASDMALLYAFNRMLDPASVVRESEFAAAAASGAIDQRIAGYVLRVATGERLPESLREQFLGEARNIYNNNRRPYDRLEREFRERARRWNLNPDDVISPFANPDADADPQQDGTPENRTSSWGATPQGRPVPAPAQQPQQPAQNDRRAQLQRLAQEARRELGVGATQADIEAYIRRRLAR